jgi:hypothetical protein
VKICHLAWRSAERTLSAWPPRWIATFKREDMGPLPGNGVLESVTRIESRLLRLTMRFKDREYVGMLTWDPPPSLADIEPMLRANLGREIQVIGELDVD